MIQEYKHTPGPWFTDIDGRIWRRHPQELYENGGGVAGDKPLATCHRAWYGEDRPYPIEANARLIASAPDLLAALEAIVNSDMAMMVEDEGRKSDELDKARAAIAKATV